MICHYSEMYLKEVYCCNGSHLKWISTSEIGLSTSGERGKNESNAPFLSNRFIYRDLFIYHAFQR